MDQKAPPGAVASMSGGAEAKQRISNHEVRAMVIAAVVLSVVLAFSATVTLDYGLFAQLPIYGRWGRAIDAWAVTLVPATCLLAFVAWLVMSTRVSTRVALPLLVGTGVVAAAAIALVRGDVRHLTRGISTRPNSPYYTSDLHILQERGVRGFVENFPDLVPTFQTPASRTHPAGIHLLLNAAFEFFGSEHALRITTSLAVLSMCAAVAAWAMGRELGGERAGRIAAVLFVAAPGPLLLAYTSMDAIYATALTSVTALFMVAIHRQSPLWSASAGAALGVATLLTYASAFVALGASLAIVVQLRDVRQAARLLLPAAIGGMLVLGFASITVGFDLLGSYHATPTSGGSYHPYWIIGAPSAILLWAGIPLAALGILGLVRTVPGARKAVLPLIMVLIMLVWVNLPPEVVRLRAGEVERTWAFLYPMLAAAAAPIVGRWTEAAGRRKGAAILVALVVMSVVQAALIQLHWDTVY